MLQVHHITKYYGGNKILDDVNFHISPREKIGLMGTNGSGKTTLLKIIQGMIEADEGQVIFSGHSPSALLSQEVDVNLENTIHQEMRRALPGIISMERQLRIFEEEMTANSDDLKYLEQLVLEYTTLLEQYESQKGMDLDWKIDLVLQGLGFHINDRNRLVSEFSGGWQMRLGLAKLLLQEKEMLLLDEPTNHLDLKAIEWLEEYLAQYPGAVIIVSHDRYFLNRIIKGTLHLERGKVRYFPGNYEDFIQKRAHEREIQEQAYKTQQKKLEKDQRFIERFRYKATLASRVKSRERMLDKMDLIEAPTGDLKSISFSFEEEKKDMTVAFRLRDLEKSYPGKIVPLSGEIEIMGKDRIALLGENGSGKTTLLRILAGIDGNYKGKLTTHPSAEIAYYLQNHAEQLNEENTVLEELREVAPGELSTETLRTILGSFLFKKDDVFKKVGVLSGGEKSRLAIAGMVCSPANILLMDEPTNHLDFESREVLAQSLNTFDGTVIVISHDRYFIEQVCDRVIEIEDGKLINYPGNYSYYKRKREMMKDNTPWVEVSEQTKEPTTDRGMRRAKSKLRQLKKSQAKQSENVKVIPFSKGRLRDEIARIEEYISSLEMILNQLELELQNPEYISDHLKLSKVLETYSKTKEELDSQMLQWEELNENID
jgi:ATP-binding cassette subfamily F protein 3